MTTNSPFVKQSEFSVCLKKTEGLQNQKGKCNHNPQVAFKERMLVLVHFPWVAGQVLLETCLWAFVSEPACSRAGWGMDLAGCQRVFCPYKLLELSCVDAQFIHKAGNIKLLQENICICSSVILIKGKCWLSHCSPKVIIDCTNFKPCGDVVIPRSFRLFTVWLLQFVSRFKCSSPRLGLNKILNSKRANMTDDKLSAITLLKSSFFGSLCFFFFSGEWIGNRKFWFLVVCCWLVIPLLYSSKKENGGHRKALPKPDFHVWLLCFHLAF